MIVSTTKISDYSFTDKLVQYIPEDKKLNTQTGREDGTGMGGDATLNDLGDGTYENYLASNTLAANQAIDSATGDFAGGLTKEQAAGYKGQVNQKAADHNGGLTQSQVVEIRNLVLNQYSENLTNGVKGSPSNQKYEKDPTLNTPEGLKPGEGMGGSMKANGFVDGVQENYTPENKATALAAIDTAQGKGKITAQQAAQMKGNVNQIAADHNGGLTVSQTKDVQNKISLYDPSSLIKA
jgi:hypothetical protein